MSLFSIVPGNLRCIRGTGGADVHLHLAGRFHDTLFDTLVDRQLGQPLRTALADAVRRSPRCQLYLRLRREHETAQADLDAAKAAAKKLSTERAYLESSCPEGAAARLVKLADEEAKVAGQQADAHQRAAAVQSAMDRAHAAAVDELRGEMMPACQDVLDRLSRRGDELRQAIERALPDDVLLELVAVTSAAFLAARGHGADPASVLAAAKPAKGDGRAAEDLDAAAKLPATREPGEAATVPAGDADDDENQPFIMG